MNKKTNTRRRVFIHTALLSFLAYPLLRFIGFSVPKKPEKITINQKIPAQRGVLLEKRFFLFDRNNKIWAISRHCTHLGCTVNYDEKNDVLECPCHQSRFDAENGSVINGPAKRSLPLYPVDKNGTTYVVSIQG